MARTTSKTAARASSNSSSGSHAREVGGIVLLALGVFLTLSMASLQFGEGNLMGPLGRFFGQTTYGIAGIASYLIVGAMIVVAVRVLGARSSVQSFAEGSGLLLGVFSLSILLHLAFAGYRVAGHGPGGALGEGFAEILRGLVSTVGTSLLGAAGLLIALVALTPLEMAHLGRGVRAAALVVWGGLRFAGVEVARFLGEVIGAILPERDEEDGEEEEEEEEILAAPKKTKKEKRDEAALAAAGIPIEGMDGDTIRVGDPTMEPIIVEPQRAKKERKRKETSPGPSAAAGVIDTAASDAALAVADLAAEAASEEEGEGEPSPKGARGRAEPVIVEPAFHAAAQQEIRDKEKQIEKDRRDYIPLGDGKYKLPPISLLKYDDTSINIDKEAMRELAARLVTTLETYGIKGQVTAIRPGPVVTMFEYAPAPGTRVSKIANLSDDLAMALEALSVRIIAPIPGKAAVGIEVPNKHRETVFFKEIIADDVFQKSKSKLQIALGKDSEGRPVAVDLAKMPHLLVAGTTGAGKSVSVNAMIASILYNATPEEVRMIMVDPKMLELSIYEGIPHLLLPVVTDPQKANLALKWAVAEMERRYQLMADEGVKDLITFNKKIETKSAAAAQIVVEAAEGEGESAEDMPAGTQLAFAEGTSPGAKAPLKKLPYVVIVIDEFADLMMCAPKDVEHSITRLAQKARACGIHLLLATQRPTTEVITGLIKSNIPSRIAFRVTNKVNSIAILEQSGAEQLLGQGDSLFSDRGTALRRVHGCLVQDEEIHGLADFLRKQGKPVYDMDILKPPPGEEGDEGDAEAAGDELSDDMYDKAVGLVAETRTASVSWIQRRLRVGYNRAARMIERMEREGVVGPATHGSNRREVLVNDHSMP